MYLEQNYAGRDAKTLFVANWILATCSARLVVELHEANSIQHLQTSSGLEDGKITSQLRAARHSRVEVLEPRHLPAFAAGQVYLASTSDTLLCQVSRAIIAC